MVVVVDTSFVPFLDDRIDQRVKNEGGTRAYWTTFGHSIGIDLSSMCATPLQNFWDESTNANDFDKSITSKNRERMSYLDNTRLRLKYVT